MYRWHKDRSITYRQWKKHHRIHVESNVDNNYVRDGENYILRSSIWDVDCACDTQIGRFRKIDAFDCGKTACSWCNPDKYPKRNPTYQEWCAQKKLEEGIEELHLQASRGKLE